MRLHKKPIRILKHGIRIISERRVGDRFYCYIEAHRFFPNSTPNASGKITVQRSRVVMTAKIGRVLKSWEHVHHKNEKRKFDDSIRNLEILTAADHNKHHKTGTRHKRSSRAKIGAGVRRAFAEGRMKRHKWFGKDNPFFGQKHSEESLAKMRRPKKRKTK